MKKYRPAAEAMVYECVRCGVRSRADRWSYPETGVWKCPECGYKCARKVRPPVVKRVKTL
ncbi:MAG: DNA-directed RNA polymerase subunit P [Candidatus Bathyarchaeum sp.]|nr:MAG: DNA-directed RNA polymerase subunit P [Candidatus Bathyarchaeum sp.]